MSAPIDDGGPAFPQDLQGRRGDDPQYQGMTIRDYFAGQYLAGWIARPDANSDERSTAKWAYEHADAMIAARKGGVDES